jgi:glycine cleavage system H protein
MGRGDGLPDELKLTTRKGEISRRELLKSIGMVCEGAMVASTVFYSACKSREASNPVTSFVYVAPPEAPPMLDYPGLMSLVASDRLYSCEHVWIKSVLDDMAIIGITDKMQRLLGSLGDAGYGMKPVGKGVVLSPVGSILAEGASFASIESSKMSLEAPMPVNGKIVQIDDALISSAQIVNTDPYGAGWMLVVHLSQPDELYELLSPEEYAALITK